MLVNAFSEEQKNEIYPFSIFGSFTKETLFDSYFANASHFPLGPLNQTQMDDLEEVIIEHHLHVSKHMIMLLKLNPDQLEPLDDSQAFKRIKRYLFSIISKLEFP